MRLGTEGRAADKWSLTRQRHVTPTKKRRVGTAALLLSFVFSSMDEIEFSAKYVSDAHELLCTPSFTPTEENEEPTSAECKLFISPTGTGKTHWIVQHLLRYAKTFLVLTTRRALAEFYKEVLEEAFIDVTCYMDERSPQLEKDQLIVSLESSWKTIIGGKVREYDIVVIDEAVQFLEHIHSPTIQQRTLLWNLLRQYIKGKAKRVYFFDAFAMPDHIDALQVLCYHNVVVYRNTYPKQECKFFRYESFRDWENTLKAIFGEGKRVVVVCSCKKLLMYLYVVLLKVRPLARLCALTGDSDTRTVALFVESRKDLTRYDAVLYTSVVGAGLDIQSEGYDHCFVFADGASCSVPSVRQMMDRFRKLKEKHIYIEPLYNKKGEMQRMEYQRLADRDTMEQTLLNHASQSVSLYRSLNEFHSVLLDCLAEAIQELAGPIDQYTGTIQRKSTHFRAFLAIVLSYIYRCRADFRHEFYATLSAVEVIDKPQIEPKGARVHWPSVSRLQDDYLTLAAEETTREFLCQYRVPNGYSKEQLNPQTLAAFRKSGKLDTEKRRLFWLVFIATEKEALQEQTAATGMQASGRSRDFHECPQSNRWFVRQDIRKLLSYALPQDAPPSATSIHPVIDTMVARTRFAEIQDTVNERQLRLRFDTLPPIRRSIHSMNEFYRALLHQVGLKLRPDDTKRTTEGTTENGKPRRVFYQHHFEEHYQLYRELCVSETIPEGFFR